MNTPNRKTIPLLLLALLLSAIPAAAAPVRVTITKKDDNIISGWVTKGSATTLYVTTNPKAPGAALPWSQIANVVWEDPDDWKEGWKLWTRRDYAAGSKAFADLAKAYEGISQIQDSIGAKAKYYQGECLRRSGRYADLMTVYDEVKRVNLSDSYQRQILLFNYWGHVGKKLWPQLDAVINKRFVKDEASVPAHTVAPTMMPLKKLDAGLLIQIAYMRGISTEMLGRAELKTALAALDPQVPETQAAVNQARAFVKRSLTDYARVFTLTYMSERKTAQEAMERSMAIYKDDPSFKDDLQLQKEAYAVATFYKDLFGKGSVPAAYKSFLVEPKEPESTSELKEEKD